ncbi:GlxA family transcriptional regulator [Actinorugispora endophytica]|uniref:AraC family transcriptional regulator with amidase-like domain n=1 Tax=Actinorugispora endophytica TaxID=1605990 RepID=A0A4R6V3M7_9ACTN|nr:AraC family transcriptional regulator [Actinorugispora endophytica]TDQ54985.1 AraC family transcriptional regulator with amidase-like domain [Actinorugispora endophytica]
MEPKDATVVVGVLAMPRLFGLDVTIPVHVFGRHPAYRVMVCGDGNEDRPGGRESASLDEAVAGVRTTHPLGDAVDADILIVPGYGEPYLPVPERYRRTLRVAYERRARIVGICTGVFALADAGLLSGRTATVHWRYAEYLRECFTDIEVVGNRLLVEDGRVLTSAGASAGIDTCLHLIEADLGTAAADGVAREVVTEPARPAEKAQYSTARPHTRETLRATLGWAADHLGDPITVAVLAERSRMSKRTLVRHFVRETGMPPMRWVTLRRIVAVRRLLEVTDWTIERIAAETGFGSPVNLRTIFRREVGVTPSAYRRMRGADAGHAAEDPP